MSLTKLSLKKSPPEPEGAVLNTVALYDVIYARRSVRRYRGAALPPAQVERLIRAAAQAPSAHNRQPWRFVVIDDPATRDRLARAMGARLRADRSADSDDLADIDRDVARSYARIIESPTVLLVALTLDDMDVYGDGLRNNYEYIMAVQSTAMAVQNLLLAAQAEGLGACWMCAPLFCSDTVLAVLGLPAHWHAQALVTLGAPARPGRLRKRKPLDEVMMAR